VTQDVHTVLRQLRSTRRSQHAILHHLGQRLAVVLAQHVGTPEMPMIAERGRESDRERHIPQSFAISKKLSQLGRRATLRPPQAYRIIKVERLMVRRLLERERGR
jgi:hypothetical protein